jgi:hypothetical protein
MGRKAQALLAMQRTLLDLADRCHGDGRPDRPILDELSGAGKRARRSKCR